MRVTNLNLTKASLWNVEFGPDFFLNSKIQSVFLICWILFCGAKCYPCLLFIMFYIDNYKPCNKSSKVCYYLVNIAVIFLSWMQWIKLDTLMKNGVIFLKSNILSLQINGKSICKLCVNYFLVMQVIR